MGDALKRKAIVSACLLGEYCRYDGKTKQDRAVLDALKEYEIIPFCPEAPVFGTPRERINVMECRGRKTIFRDSGEDVTHKLTREIENFIRRHPQADRIVLKSKSPSCGIGTTPIFDCKKRQAGVGNGLAADMFLNSYKEVVISDERRYHSL